MRFQKNVISEKRMKCNEISKLQMKYKKIAKEYDDEK